MLDEVPFQIFFLLETGTVPIKIWSDSGSYTKIFIFISTVFECHGSHTIHSVISILLSRQRRGGLWLPIVLSCRGSGSIIELFV